MFLRSTKYKNYYLAKSKNGFLEMFRDGRQKPLKPIKRKNEIKYALSFNGERIEISITEFLKSCKEFQFSSQGSSHTTPKLSIVPSE